MTSNAQSVIEHRTCRLCGSGDLVEAFSIGEQNISDFVPLERIGTGRRAPLTLVMCPRCSLIQLRHTAPQELLYSRHYWYRSGVTDTMKQALADVSKAVTEYAGLKSGDVVLDIGANDGTLLESFVVEGLIRVGCEPADNLIKELSGRSTYVMHDFWSSEAFEPLARKWGIAKPKAITALGMFYDLEDPNTFIAGVKRALADGGVFVAQLMCLGSMLKQNDLGNICHEHIEYYSLESLRYLFENNGLEIFKLEENAVNGGSYRLFARHYDKGSIPFDERFTIDHLHEFKARVDDNRDKCVSFLKNEVAKGKKVFVYGASTKGNVILQYYGLDTSLIVAAAERSPEKWGKYTAGSWIPIISEEEARAAQPDYFLVLPWAFLDEFLVREKAWRQKGGRFIVPLPQFRVI